MLIAEIPTLRTIFFEYGLMPCCGKERNYFLGPCVGLFQNIKCAHCGEKFNIDPEAYFIEKI